MKSLLTELKDFNYPVKVSQDKIKVFNSSAKNIINQLNTDNIFYYVGLEYSDYIQESYRLSRSGQDIFNDVGRYDSYLTEFNYYSNKNSKYANSFYQTIENDCLNDLRFFIGKKGQKTSLHFDWNSSPIILFNEFGEKSIRFISPLKSRSLKGFANFSLDNTKDWDFEINIKENEAVLIPTFWWHQVEYMTNAKSISYRLKNAGEYTELIKLIYPSWKIVYYLSADDNYQNLLSQIVSLDHLKDSKKYFNEMENFLNSEINHTDKDHPYYEKYIIDYLKHYKIRE